MYARVTLSHHTDTDWYSCCAGIFSSDCTFEPHYTFVRLFVVSHDATGFYWRPEVIVSTMGSIHCSRLNCRRVLVAESSWSVNEIVNQFNGTSSSLIHVQDSSSFVITGSRSTLLTTTCGVFQPSSCTTKYFTQH